MLWDVLKSCILQPQYYHPIIFRPMIQKGLFQVRWTQVYNAIVAKNQSKVQLPFGVREQFKVKKQANYIIVQNVSLSQKRYSRAVEIAYQKQSVELPFDQAEFNFTKIDTNQVLFGLGKDEKGGLTVFQNSSSKSQLSYPRVEHWVVINGAPINQFHSLFLPFVHQKHPQLLTLTAIQEALSLQRLLPNYKIAFNSQGAASSVNHLHFQIISTALFNQSQPLEIQLIQGQSLVFEGCNPPDSILTAFEKNGALYVKVDYSPKTPTESIAQVLYQLTQQAIIESLPHNLILLGQGSAMVIYRNFATCDIKFGFLEYLQILLANSAQEFQSMNGKVADLQYQKLALSRDRISKLLHSTKLIKLQPTEGPAQ